MSDEKKKAQDEATKQNLEIYNQFRNPPASARDAITGGRLKGKTQINPMWRIQCLTEAFGPCGIGWYYEEEKTELLPGTKNEVLIKVTVKLYYKWNGEWSKGILGVGAHHFVDTEKGANINNKEFYKMALTDALGTCCKALGIGADVYMNDKETQYCTDLQLERIFELVAKDKRDALRTYYHVEDLTDLSHLQAEQIIEIKEKAINKDKEKKDVKD